MTPTDENNFLIEVPQDVYNEMMKHLDDEQQFSVVLHYSPYWKETAKSKIKDK
jgi:hypothetical protein